MDTAKVRVKFGTLEVEYEGDQAFVRSGLLDLIGDVVGLSKHAPSGPANANSREPTYMTANGVPGPSDLTISTIAAHLQPDGPQELIMCALAKLQIVDGLSKAERSEISKEMRNATAYFKATMTNNLPRDLGRMVKGKKINEISSGVYSLTAASRQELEAKIAGIG